MNLKFSHLHLENFMSFKEADVDLSASGFVYVIGENQNIDDGASSNGSGKSTIFEAIYWCLTGETVRGSKDVVNHDFEDLGCYVELQFYADGKFVELLRSKNHKKYKTNLIIKIDGNDISAKGIRDSEKVFETNFPELSSDLIGSVIILGQGLPNRFTANTPSGRKQVLEQLTNSDCMIELLKERLNNRETELKTALSQLSLNASNLIGQKSILTKQISDLESKKESSNRDELQKQLDEENGRMDALIKKLNDTMNDGSLLKEERNEVFRKVSEKRADVSELSNYKSIEISKVREKYSPKLIEVNSNISSLTAYIKKAESIKDVCPTCGQKLIGVEKIDCSVEKAKLAEALEEKKTITATEESEVAKINAEYADRINKANSELTELQKKYNEVDGLVKTNESAVRSIENDKTRLESTIRATMSALALVDVDYDSQIAEIKKSVDDIDANLLYINNEAENVNNHSSVISKFQTFAKRDFRGYLLEQYIYFLNSTAKRYCSSLFGSDKISIKLDGNNLSISYLDKEYESLSGGERQKVDLLVQFSIREMLRSTLNFSSNILVLDEITDNLDAEGCQKLIDFVSTSFGDLESIFLISHRKDLDIPYDSEIRVVKGSDGISRIM